MVLGDGALGHPADAPYDRMIATVGAFDIPTAWMTQLAPAGRMVVPVRLAAPRPAASSSNEASTGGPAEAAPWPCSCRCAASATTPAASSPYADGVTLQVHQDQDVAGQDLDGVLAADRHESWTGVVFPPMVPYEWMDLWLALTLPNSIMRMNVDKAAADSGLVTPMFGWGSMATTQGAQPGLPHRPPRPTAA